MTDLPKGLAFDDILLLPRFTEIKREEINLAAFLSPKIKLSVPLISAPMDTVTDAKLAIALGKLGGLGVIHRNSSVENQAKEVISVKKEIPFVAAAVGVGNDLVNRLDVLVSAGLDVVVVDSAHGFSKFVVEATEYIVQKYPQLFLISGNVATFEGAKKLISSGTNALRVGMGPGSICTTRIVAGIGVPQFTAIFETARAAGENNIPIIADGGIRSSGDIVKALSAGASAVMLGSLFAGCEEAPGELVTVEGKKYKSYRGMGSLEAMKEGSAARYGQQYRQGQEKKLVAEGVAGLVPYRGTLEEVVTQLIGGLRSGMYYVGAKDIKELQEKAQFLKITKAGLAESHPHDIYDFNR